MADDCIINDVGCSPEFAEVTNLNTCCGCLGFPLSLENFTSISQNYQCNSQGGYPQEISHFIENTKEIINFEHSPIANIKNRAYAVIDKIVAKLNANEPQFKPEETARDLLMFKINLLSEEVYAYVLALVLMIVELAKIVFYIIITRAFVFLILEFIPSIFFKLRDALAHSRMFKMRGGR